MNKLVNWIAEIEKILAIKSEKIRIAEHLDVQYRGLDAYLKDNGIVIGRELLQSAFHAHRDCINAELKELGYEP